MTVSRVKAKGRKTNHSFISLPHYILNHQKFLDLGAQEIKLLIDLCAQYKGNNNGDIDMTWSRMKTRGWKSRDTLGKARNTLLNKQWIVIARQGWRRTPTLYALTIFNINECNGKINIPHTNKPPHSWKQGETQ